MTLGINSKLELNIGGLLLRFAFLFLGIEHGLCTTLVCSMPDLGHIILTVASLLFD